MTQVADKTYFSLHDYERSVKTRRLSEDDWLLPEYRGGEDRGEETTADKPERPESSWSAITTQRALPKMPEPIRKDGITIAGSGRTITLLQQWECVILDVTEDCVACEMHDLTNNARPVEYAEILIDEFHVYDRQRLAEGAIAQDFRTAAGRSFYAAKTGA